MSCWWFVILLVTVNGAPSPRRSSHRSSSRDVSEDTDRFAMINTAYPRHVTSDHFISLTLDPSMLPELPWADQRIIRLARELSPAWLKIAPINSHTSSSENFTMYQWAAINHFTAEAGMKQLWDAQFFSTAALRWKNNNFKDSKTMIQSVPAVHVFPPVPQKIGFLLRDDGVDDLARIRQVFPGYNSATVTVTGPDSAFFKNLPEGDNFWNWLHVNSQNISAVSWKPSRLIPPQNRTLSNVLSTEHSDVFKLELKVIQDMMDTNHIKTKSIWIGDASLQWEQSTTPLSIPGSFGSALLWFDRLASAAESGVSMVFQPNLLPLHKRGVREAPTPEYWISLLYKRLAGPQVLDVQSRCQGNAPCRLYAHCTPHGSLYSAGDVTVIGLNMHDVELKGNVSELSHEQDDYIHQYILSGNIDSGDVYLNGKKLEIDERGLIPAIHPILITSINELIVPAFSMAFWVFPRVGAKACGIERGRDKRLSRQTTHLALLFPVQDILGHEQAKRKRCHLSRLVNLPRVTSRRDAECPEGYHRFDKNTCQIKGISIIAPGCSTTDLLQRLLDLATLRRNGCCCCDKQVTLEPYQELQETDPRITEFDDMFDATAPPIRSRLFQQDHKSITFQQPPNPSRTQYDERISNQQNDDKLFQNVPYYTVRNVNEKVESLSRINKEQNSDELTEKYKSIINNEVRRDSEKHTPRPYPSTLYHVTTKSTRLQDYENYPNSYTTEKPGNLLQTRFQKTSGFESATPDQSQSNLLQEIYQNKNGESQTEITERMKENQGNFPDPETTQSYSPRIKNQGSEYSLQTEIYEDIGPDNIPSTTYRSHPTKDFETYTEKSPILYSQHYKLGTTGSTQSSVSNIKERINSDNRLETQTNPYNENDPVTTEEYSDEKNHFSQTIYSPTPRYEQETSTNSNNRLGDTSMGYVTSSSQKPGYHGEQTTENYISTVTNDNKNTDLRLGNKESIYNIPDSNVQPINNDNYYHDPTNTPVENLIHEYISTLPKSSSESSSSSSSSDSSSSDSSRRYMEITLENSTPQSVKQTIDKLLAITNQMESPIKPGEITSDRNKFEGETSRIQQEVSDTRDQKDSQITYPQDRNFNQNYVNTQNNDFPGQTPPLNYPQRNYGEVTNSQPDDRVSNQNIYSTQDNNAQLNYPQSGQINYDEVKKSQTSDISSRLSSPYDDQNRNQYEYNNQQYISDPSLKQQQYNQRYPSENTYTSNYNNENPVENNDYNKPRPNYLPPSSYYDHFHSQYPSETKVKLDNNESPYDGSLPANYKVSYSNYEKIDQYAVQPDYQVPFQYKPTIKNIPTFQKKTQPAFMKPRISNSGKSSSEINKSQNVLQRNDEQKQTNKNQQSSSLDDKNTIFTPTKTNDNQRQSGLNSRLQSDNNENDNYKNTDTNLIRNGDLHLVSQYRDPIVKQFNHYSNNDLQQQNQYQDRLFTSNDKMSDNRTEVANRVDSGYPNPNYPSHYPMNPNEYAINQYDPNQYVPQEECMLKCAACDKDKFVNFIATLLRQFTSKEGSQKCSSNDVMSFAKQNQRAIEQIEEQLINRNDKIKMGTTYVECPSHCTSNPCVDQFSRKIKIILSIMSWLRECLSNR